MDPQDWEAMYRSRDQVFSGSPNGVLVAEAMGLPPGRALDVGCGEGADAIWLARHGWHVTAVDVAQPPWTAAPLSLLRQGSPTAWRGRAPI